MEPHRTEKALQSFADLNDSRLYKHFNSMVNVTTDIEALIRARVIRIVVNVTFRTCSDTLPALIRQT